MTRRTPRRATRARRTRGDSVVGRRLEAEVGPVAHGGHCVARVPVEDGQSRVVFVRHALPGERVVLEVTEGGTRDRFWRADAVEVLEPSPERVEAPCPVAGPGLCGGCDFQHVALPVQRDLKTAVVREQLVRLGGMDPEDELVRGLEVRAVPVPGRPDDGLRWRTRTRFATTPDGRVGLRRHRSHEVVPLPSADCPITAESALVHPESASTNADSRGIGADSTGDRVETVVVGEGTAEEAGHEFTRAADGFWQVHPEAPRVLVESVLSTLEPQPGESVLDLYGGVGLFARFLQDRVGADAPVTLVEGDRRATEHARRNLGEGARVVSGDVGEVLARGPVEPVDLVVLDPPRAGAGRAVVAAVAERRPRAAAYVACDPAALARDLAFFAEHGYRARRIEAFDLFPMTHHVECVALLTKTGSDLR
ncbi:methyltransferase [Nocardioides rotundus]|uniref:class I SAM-dependent RNA methyltransferase n=1 Tax=Nocardioides rotundus TaxID=1774216 RepID=UPI001CBFC9C0|nr:TRAM domain-containing protein [Nocardioides rotundus]UAL28273.1 methyltransferase [Nocardioides rotundus]